MKEKLGEKGRDPYDGLRQYSALTHSLGAALSILGAAVLLTCSVSRGDPGVWTAAFSVYCASLTALYFASSTYHSLRCGVRGRITLRKIDHLMIYVLIAGTYTPLCTIPLAGTFGTVMLAVIWGVGVLGAVFTMFWISMPRWLCSAIYVVMGWAAIFAIVPLSRTMSPAGLAWLFGGGAMYTIGAVLYALKWPGRNNPRFGCHEIFHVFILLGSVCHYMMMYRLLA